MRLLRIPLAGLALAGFLVSLWVHVSALRGVDVSRAYPQVWGLHAGLFVVFLPMVFASRRLLGRKPTMRRWRDLLPRPVGLLCGAIFIYAIVNFLLATHSMPGGSPSVQDGQYVLNNHGQVTPITAAQYEAAKATELRMFSGHWMVFYFMPFAFFLFALGPRPGLGTPLGGGRP